MKKSPPNIIKRPEQSEPTFLGELLPYAIEALMAIGVCIIGTIVILISAGVIIWLIF
jgi:hypothetical protein